jgi:hypothetical protein
MNTSLASDRKNLIDLDLEPLLTEKEYAQAINRSVASVRRDRLLRVGCPFVKLGALVRYRPSDIRAHIECSVRRTTASHRSEDGK